MKAKIGNKIFSISKDAISSHMANLLTTRDIFLGKERDFKQAFSKYKESCNFFIKENKDFVYLFGDEDWLIHYLHFQAERHALLMQSVIFQFSDGSVWSIPIMDLADLRIIHDPNCPDKNKLLQDPDSLVTYASKLSWRQVRDFVSLKGMVGDDVLYEFEWKKIPKELVRVKFDTTVQDFVSD